MKAEGLLFEVRVLRSKMPTRNPDNKHAL